MITIIGKANNAPRKFTPPAFVKNVFTAVSKNVVILKCAKYYK